MSSVAAISAKIVDPVGVEMTANFSAVAGHAVTGTRLGKSAKIDRKRNKAFPHGFLPIVDMNSTPSGSVFLREL